MNAHKNNFIKMKKTQKPRNYVALAMIKMAKGSCIHQKSNKAKRREEKVNLKCKIEDLI